MKSALQYGLLLQLFFAVGPTTPCAAQELEPRRWGHLPVNTNFAGGAFAVTQGEITFNPVLLIDDAEMTMRSWAVKYIRTLKLFHTTARVEIAQGLHDGRWQGLVDGVPSSTQRIGISDTVLRFATGLFGAPPLQGKEYAEYRALTKVETVGGLALAVHLPTGDYLPDKLINLGNNRFTFRPQLGVVHRRGPLSMELTISGWFYTENDEFFNGNTLEQKPLFTVQTHIVYILGPGIWAGAGIGYGLGGESSVNGVEKDDRKGNLVWAFNLSCPLTRHLSVKTAYVGTRTQTSVGLDSDSFVVGVSGFW